VKLPKQMPAVVRKVDRVATTPEGLGVRASYWPGANPWLDQIYAIAGAI
jgi:hypothetical protein